MIDELGKAPVKCKKCGHEWRTRSISPTVCPGCKKSCTVIWLTESKGDQDVK